jgi:hypothetical protein
MWVVGGALIVVFVVIAVVAGGGKKSKSKASPPPGTARALVVPVDRARTVVVAPCSTPLQATVRNTAAGRATPGATTVELPKASGVRTLLVPDCLAKTGATNAAGDLPSAAFVVPGSERPTEGEAGSVAVNGVAARAKLILPDGSRATDIVVPPCSKKSSSKGRTDVLSASKSTPGLVVAPSC